MERPTEVIERLQRERASGVYLDIAEDSLLRWIEHLESQRTAIVVRREDVPSGQEALLCGKWMPWSGKDEYGRNVNSFFETDDWVCIRPLPEDPRRTAIRNALDRNGDWERVVDEILAALDKESK